jgi:hypothetical protein
MAQQNPMLRIPSVLSSLEFVCGLAVAACSLVGLAFAAAWIFGTDTNLARLLLGAAFTVSSLAFCTGVLIHVTRRSDAGLLLIWLGFPVVATTAIVFVGVFASWSPLFLPIVPLALIVSCLAYVSSR